MPSKRDICYYAMYVIGEVESGWDWGSVYYVDAITIGMIQMWGPEAGGFLSRMKTETPDDYAKLADSLKSSVDAHPGEVDWWESRYLTQAEGNSWVMASSSQSNHHLQEDHAINLFSRYIDILEGWGMSQANPKPLIYAMSMYHQAPNWAGKVIGSCGGNADLDLVHSTAMNSNFSRYKNRYTTNYNRLREWDGQSPPPDFGQDGTIQIGGNPSGIETIASQISYIRQTGDMLVMYGKGELENGLLFYPSAGFTWTPSRNVSGTSIDGGWTGGGSESGSAAALAICELYRSWADKFAYGQGGGRLDPEASGYGDCSSTIWKAYQQVAGVDVGTWTGEMLGKGTLIAEGNSLPALPVSIMQPADLVLIQRRNNPDYNHVELYMGNNELWGHGGPDNGPDSSGEASSYTGGSTLTRWQVRRYL